MTDYSRQIEQIKNAQSFDEIRAAANTFSAQAQGEGAVLYSGKVGDVRSEVIAKELAYKTSLSIINDTPRAQFLSNEPVYKAIVDSSKRILAEQGMPLNQAEKSGWDFLYGDGKALPESALSVQKSLWGEASAEFAGSVRGHVVVVGSAANAERVLAQVEVPVVLHINQATTLAGQPLSSLRELHAGGGIHAVLSEVQAPFLDAARKGIFTLPDSPAGEITQVAISREVATMLQLDGFRFVGAAALSEAGFVPAPLGPPASAMAWTTGVPQISDPTLVPEDAAFRSGLSRNATRGVAGVAAVGMVYDATTTAAHTSDLLHQGNQTGAQSQIEHFGARNLGALGGAMLGAEIFGTAGAETGPLDLLIGGAGAIGGAIAGDKLANAYDKHRIYNQQDTHGQMWHYDPDQPRQGWTRDLPPLPDTPHGQRFTADPALAERLTFQANTRAVELALAHPATPRDPYTQPAGAGDTPSKLEAPWTRDAQTQQWSRHVTDQVMEHGLTSAHTDAASPQRTAQLDAAARQTIADNLAHSPRGMADHYQAIHEQRGWAQFGSMPEAVTNALKTPAHSLEASDGHTYVRNADGQWNTPGTLWGTNAAQGHVRAELDATDRMAVASEAVRQVAPSSTAPAATSMHTQAQAVMPASPAHARNDPRHPDNPDHALYNELHRRIPEASENRLLQFTAACHTNRITADNLSTIHLDEASGKIGFFGSSLLSTPSIVDLNTPSPQPQQAIQHIQHYDQQQAQMMGQMQAQNAQVNQQGPMLGGP